MSSINKLLEIVKKIGILKVALILTCAVLLLAFSKTESKKDSETIPTTTTVSDISIDSFEYEKYMEKKLKELLESMDFIKEANVFITLKGSGKKNVLTETPYNKSDTNETDSNGGVRNVSNEDKNYNTVYIKDVNGNEIPYVVTENNPDVKGVAITIKGSLDVKTQAYIVKMIESLCGVSVNNISIVIS